MIYNISIYMHTLWNLGQSTVGNMAIPNSVYPSLRQAPLRLSSFSRLKTSKATSDWFSSIFACRPPVMDRCLRAKPSDDPWLIYA